MKQDWVCFGGIYKNIKVQFNFEVFITFFILNPLSDDFLSFILRKKLLGPQHNNTVHAPMDKTDF